MRLLLRTLLWGIAVLALLCVAAPYGIGWLLYSRFDRVTSHLSIPGYVQIVRRHFDRGWFVSHARIVLRPVGPLCRSRPCPVITLDSRIDHGPLAWGAARTSLEPALAVVRTRADLTSLWPRYVFTPRPNPLVVTSDIRLDSRGRARLNLDGASFDIARRHPVAHVDTATVTGRLRSGFMARRLEGLMLDWPSFSFVPQSGGQLAWRHVHFDARPAPDGRLSRGHFTADSITLDNGQGQATRLGGVELAVRRGRPNTTTVSLDIDELVLPDNTQGTFILEARQYGLEPRAWSDLAARWHALGGRSGGALNAPGLYCGIATDLLPARSRLRIKRMELATPAGAIRARARVQAPQRYRHPDSAAALLSQLRGGFELSVPRSILRRLIAHTLDPADTRDPEAAVDARIGKLIARHLIVAVDGGRRYRMRAALDDGRMRINGRRRAEWQAVVDQLQAAAQGL